VAKAIINKEHFIYEGHFPDKENWSAPKRFKSAGYKVHMIFLGLSHPKISELRVFERAKIGGHNVPPYEIERNFFGNLKQLNIQYQIIDELQIIDTSDRDPKVLAIFINGKVIDALPIKQLPDWFETELPDLFQLVYNKKNPIDIDDVE
jgi:predicted ABC-type ATPase